MTLKDQLMEDLKDAMKSNDELRKSTIRLVRSAIKNAEMARSKEILDAAEQNLPAPSGVSKETLDDIKKRRRLAAQFEEESAGEESEQAEMARKERAEIGAMVAELSNLNDSGVQDVIRKEIKQRRDSADAYAHGHRQDLADKELAEVAILEKYLPQQMSEEEIEREVRGIIAEVGASGPKDMNKVMPAAMQRLRGRADGRAINQVVARLLNQG
jgi:uncharacterized protein YqeY